MVGEHERIEGIVAPGLISATAVGIALVDGREQVVDLLLQDLGAGEIVQRLGDPEALRHGVAALAGGIENVLEPGLGILELLVLAQQLRDIQRDMVEELPVVDREGRGVAEVEELAVLCHGRPVGVTAVTSPGAGRRRCPLVDMALRADGPRRALTGPLAPVT